MKLLYLTLLALIGAAFGPPATPPLADTIRASRWQHRVLLLVAPTAEHADFQQQKQLLATEAAGLRDRDFRVLEACYQLLPPADQRFLTQKLGLAADEFAVVLIGKDGGVKRMEKKPLAAAALFATVDRMPMRREEMRERGR